MNQTDLKIITHDLKKVNWPLIALGVVGSFFMATMFTAPANATTAVPNNGDEDYVAFLKGKTDGVNDVGNNVYKVGATSAAFGMGMKVAKRVIYA